jgi:alpha-galactosidase
VNGWTTQLIPPELMDSHVASRHSHTTGRTHSLSFRAATAVFGHLGIEWDLAAAHPAEIAELVQWIS